jgi:hypothetical protein
MKLKVVKTGERNGPVRDYCPWMIYMPPNNGK